MARAFLAESTLLVNRLSIQAREDAIRFAREELEGRDQRSRRAPR
jgi:capsule polysaccharide export protein KpsE/RkpR